MAIGLIIIGDEILSGRRVDAHCANLITFLKERGLQLSWVEIIGDDKKRITDVLRRTMATQDIVFCCGGIGATPDDHTRQCAADALGVPLALHPLAKAKIQERIVDMAVAAGSEPNLESPENLHRLKMGEIPEGANIIPNFYNKIPGFSVQHQEAGAHYFMPGFPIMTGPMMAWVLDTYYAKHFHQEVVVERAVKVIGMMESTLTPLMEEIEKEFISVKIFSLPSVGDADTQRHIELGVKGSAAQVELAFKKLKEGLDKFNAQYQ